MEGQGRVEAEWHIRKLKVERATHKVRWEKESGDSCQLCDLIKAESPGISPALSGFAVICSSLTEKTAK